MRVLICALLTGLTLSAASAQNLVIQDDRVHTARRLAGTIYAGETELRGGLLPDATVELCETRWKHCSEKVISDSHARFSLHPRHYRNVYYLRISHENCNQMLLKVHVNPRARHDLEISVTVAT